jgi:ribosome-associated toxin RatA of RatAB toxin-antitoxin module
MRKLEFVIHTKATTKNVWQLMSNVDNYYKYIKYCHKSKLVGNFQEGSSWYDWSTVMFLPLKINHKIVNIVPNKKIVYLISSQFGEIRQTILIIKEGKATQLTLKVNIDFPNRLIDKTFGAFVSLRNKKMLEATIQNYKKAFQ